MKILRRLFLTAALLAIATPTGIHALGLGEIELKSALNQPLNAKIRLLSADERQINDLRVTLASPQVFERAGVDRPHFLTTLKFTPILGDDGKAYIRVVSPEPVHEPFLTFILELTWPTGNLRREYTVLLDPPSLMSARKPAVSVPAAPPRRAAAPAPVVLSDDPSLPAPGTPVETFGPTGRNYSLWRIAMRLRTDESLSVEQVMLGLLRSNPEAFNGNNVNGLKTGYMLKVPSVDEIRDVNAAEALATVRRHNAEWPEMRAALLAGAVPTPSTVPGEPIQRQPAPPAPPAAESGRLRLVGTEAAAEGGTGGGAAAHLREELARATEAEAASGREAQELAARVMELEEQINDLRQLLTLKDRQLSRMQERLRSLGEELPLTGEEQAVAEPPATPPPATPEVSKPEPSPVGEESPAEPLTSEARDDVELLLDPQVNAAERAAAAWRLGESGRDDAVPALVTALQGDENWTVRRNAAEALGALKTATAVEPLIEALAGDEQVYVRAAAAEALGRIGDPRALNALEAALDDGAVVNTNVDGQWVEVKAVAEAATAALNAIEAAMPAPASAPATPPAAPAAPQPAPAGLLDSLPIDPTDPVVLGGAGALILLLGLGGVVALRRRRGKGEATPAAAPVAAAPAAGADPLEEAELHLQAGRYQQAEDLLKQAAAAAPARKDLKFKLLEIYHQAKDVSSFVLLAGQMRPLLGEESPEWVQLRSRGRELAPSDPLFSGAAAAEGDAEEPEVELEIPESMGLDLDLSAMETAEFPAMASGPGEEAGADLDFDLSGPGAGGGQSGAAEEESGELDFDLSMPEGVEVDEEISTAEAPLKAAAEPVAAEHAVAEKPGEEAGLDFDLTLPGDLGGVEAAAAPVVEVEAEEKAEGADAGLDFDLTLPGSETTAEQPSATATAAESGEMPGLDFDLTLPGGEEAPAETQEEAGSEGEAEAPGLDFELTLPGDFGSVVADEPDVEAAVEKVPATATEESAPSLDFDLTPAGAEESSGVEPTAEEGAVDEAALDLGLDLDAELPSLELPAESEEAAEEPLGLDLGLGEEEPEPLDLGLDLGDEAAEEGALDLGLDLPEPGGEEGVANEPQQESEPEAGLELPAEEAALDLELPAEPAEPEVETEVAEPEPEPEAGEPFLDLTLPGLEVEEEVASLDDAAAPTAEPESVEESLDLELPGLESAEEEISLDLGPAEEARLGAELAEEGTGLDLNLPDLGDEEEVSLDLSLPDLPDLEDEEDRFSLDLPEGEELGETLSMDLGALEAEAPGEDLESTMALDRSPMLELPEAEPAAGLEASEGLLSELESADEEEGEEAAGERLPADVDEVANKLDLARAFIGMGDKEGARGLLEEVLAEGSGEQKAEADEMMAGLD